MPLPGWSSPTDVRSIHASLEGWALVFFAALVVFDVVAHFETKRKNLFEKLALVFFGLAIVVELTAYPYSRRNDELSATEIARLNEQAEAERLARIDLEAEIQPRYLTQEQQRGITDNLRPFAGSELLIGSHWNDAESARLARQIQSVLNAAGIGIKAGSPADLIGKYPQIPVGMFGGGMVTGGEIHTGIEVWGAGKGVVADALRRIGKLGVATPLGASPFNFDVPGLITIFVGVKPLPEVR